jgi:hypothetical protein
MSSVIASDYYNTLEVGTWYSRADISRSPLSVSLFNILRGYNTDGNSPNIINEGWVEYDQDNDRFRPLKVGEAYTWNPDIYRGGFTDPNYYYWKFIPGTINFHYSLYNYTGGEYTPVKRDKDTITYNISSANDNPGVTVGTLVKRRDRDRSAVVNYKISYQVTRGSPEEYIDTWTDAHGMSYFSFPISPPAVYHIYIRDYDPNYIRSDAIVYIKLIVHKK